MNLQVHFTFAVEEFFPELKINQMVVAVKCHVLPGREPLEIFKLSKIFLIPLRYCKILAIPPPLHNKSGRISFFIRS